MESYLLNKLFILPTELRLLIFEAAIEAEKDFQSPLLISRVRSEPRFVAEVLPIYHSINFKITEDNIGRFKMISREDLVEVVRHITIIWERGFVDILDGFLDHNKAESITLDLCRLFVSVSMNHELSPYHWAVHTYLYLGSRSFASSLKTVKKFKIFLQHQVPKQMLPMWTFNYYSGLFGVDGQLQSGTVGNALDVWVWDRT